MPAKNSIAQTVENVLHIQHARLKERKKSGPHLTVHELSGFNGKLALFITGIVSTMWCAYIFAIIAFISFPAALHGGIATTISWIAEIFLQLVLLSVIMVGQKVASQASDKQASQTFKDTEAILELQDEVHRLMEINNAMTEDIRKLLTEKLK